MRGAPESPFRRKQDASRLQPLTPLLVATAAFDLFILLRSVLGRGHGPGGRSNPYAYDWVVLLLFVPYTYALLTHRRRDDAPSLRAVLLGAGALSVPLVFALPPQSHDVFQYLFYARMQIEYGANPYVVAPVAYTADAAFRYVGWPHQVSVYGPLWSLAVVGTILAVHDHVLASMFAIKGMVLALEAIAVWGLVRLRPGPGISGAPARWVLAFALNPLVLTTLALGGHADAALAAGFVWAIAWDQRGRPVVAGLLLALTAFVKAYAALPLAVYAFAVWRRGERREALSIVAGSVALSTLVYLPYWTGTATFRGILGMTGLRSSSLGGTIEGWLGSIFRAAGVDRPLPTAALGIHLVSLLVVAAVATLLARSPRTVREPWRASALLMAAFLLVTPWSLPWYAVGLTALAVPLSDVALSDAVLTFSGTSLAPGSLLAGGVRSVLRYGPPAAVYTRCRRAVTGPSRHRPPAAVDAARGLPHRHAAARS